MRAFTSVHQLVDGEVAELKAQNERERIKFDLFRKSVLDQEEKRLRLMQAKQRQHERQRELRQRQPFRSSMPAPIVHYPARIRGVWVDEIGALADEASNAYSDEEYD